jgi:hypothetical protein
MEEIKTFVKGHVRLFAITLHQQPAGFYKLATFNNDIFHLSGNIKENQLPIMIHIIWKWTIQGLETSFTFRYFDFKILFLNLIDLRLILNFKTSIEFLVKYKV